MTSTLVFVKYLKEGKFNSQLFAVLKKSEGNKKLNDMVKDFNDSKYLYLKDKHLSKVELVKFKTYALKLYLDEFVGKDGKEVVYVSGIFDKSRKNLSVIKEIDEESQKEFAQSVTKNECLDSSDEDE